VNFVAKDKFTESASLKSFPGPAHPHPKVRKPFCGLIERREARRLTWRGWLLVLSIFLVFVIVIGRNLAFFLALSAPIDGEVLVVEGWAPDYALTSAISEFKRHPYSRLYVTGGPLQSGAPLSEYKTYAELGAATILRLGLGPESVQAVPAPAIRKDRTYTSALALKDWFRQHGVAAHRLNLISVGPHSRRTHLLFRKVFNGEAEIGVLAIEDEAYDPARWWQSSAGVRAVLDELIAYGYARVFFHSDQATGAP